MAFNFSNQSETDGTVTEKHHESDNLQVEIKQLELGDIVLCDENESILLVFERKSINDLASSLYDGRYREQSSRLSGFSVHNNNIIYIVEGNIDSPYMKKGNINSQVLRACVASLNLNKEFSVLKTTTMDDTARWILSYAYKVIKDKALYEKLISMNSTRVEHDTTTANNEETDVVEPTNDKTHQQTHLSHLAKQTKSSFITKDNINMLMLSMIPNVSTTIATAIMEQFSTIENLIATLREDNNALNNIYITTNSKKRKLGKNVIENIKSMLIASSSSS